MAEQKEGHFEKVLRSVLISSKGGVPLQKLNGEFKELSGEDIPYRKNGFQNVEAYLRSMPQVVQIRRDASGQMMCMGVANEETQHLDRLVKKQKASKKKSKPSRVPKFAGRPSNRPRRPPPHVHAQNLSQRKGNPPNQPSQRPRGTSQDVRWTHGLDSKPRPSVNPPPQRNPRPAQHKPQKNVQPSNQNANRKVQHSSSYEVPPRFRRQVNSTGSTSDEHSWDDHHDTPPAVERSHSASDYQSAVIENTREWNNSSTFDNESYTPQQRPQPSQPPPVDDTIVSWVNEVLADKTSGLWMSGLKKLYKERFQETLDDDLQERLGRLSLWTAEEIGVSNDSILYPNLRPADSKSLSTDALRSKYPGKKQSTSIAGNDKILYPNLKVEVMQSPTSGNLRRNVANQPENRVPSASSVPSIVLPDEDPWDVYVSYVINVVDFYCIIIGEEYSDQLCSLEDEMREFYQSENMNLRLAEMPALSGLYAARLNDDWLRVTVIAVEDDEAGCFLVDHGDIESVPLSDLRALNQNFFHLAFQAIPCKLHGLESKAASETATTRFCNVALAQTRLAEVMSRETRVSLTLYRDSLNINYLCALGELI